MSSKETYFQLPAMPVSSQVTWDGVEVVGLVRTPLSLNMEDLAQFSRSKAVLDFRCHDGWVAPAQRWEGVPVSTVLDQADADLDANYVSFSCGEFVHTLTLEEAKAPDTLLAVQLNGQSVSHKNGGPCRLVAGDRMGPAHVKWLQRIEVTNEAPDG
ncbi:MAG: molybdopterin-dependent oxidoreductase [Chloroflexi bacterium]|nr:molybdopterin-dependent oxidoreductase [Chloroflexota bacterium]